MLESNEIINNVTVLTFKENQLQLWPDKILLFVYTLVFIVGFLGNLLTIYLVLFFKKIQSMTNKFISNLALADLLVIFLVIPENFIRLMKYNESLTTVPPDLSSRIFCKLGSFTHGDIY